MQDYLKKLLEEGKFKDILSYIENLDLSKLDSSLKIVILNYKVTALFGLGKYYDALEVTHEQLKLLEELVNEAKKLRLSIKGTQYMLLENIGKIDEALRLLDEILPDIETPEKYFYRIDQAFLLTRLGDLEGAIDILENDLKEIKEKGKEGKAFEYEILKNLANIYLYQLQDKERAKKYFELAYTLSNELKAQTKNEALLNYAKCLISLGEFEDAKSYLNNLLEETSDELKKANIYLEFSEIEEDYLEKALDIYRKYRLEEKEASILLDMGVKEKDLDKSIDMIRKAIEKFSELGIKERELQARNLLALRLYEKKDYDEAKKELMEIVKYQEFPQLLTWSYVGLATIEKDRGNYQECLKYLEIADSLFEKMRGNLFLEEKLRYNELYAVVKREYARLSTDYNVKLSFKKSEEAKARFLIEAVALSKLERPSNEAIFEMENKLIEKLNIALLNRDPHTREILAELNSIWEELDKKPEYRDYVSLRKGRVKDYEEIKNIINDNLIINYLVTNTETIVYLIDNEGIETVKINKKFREIEELAKQFLNMNKDTEIKIFEEAYKILLEPFYEKIKKAKRICISPDECLYYIPFHSLITGNHFLIEEIPIFYIPNLSLFAFLNKKLSSSGSLIVCGSPRNDLKYAMEEGKAFSEILNCDIENLDKKKIMNEMREKSIIHFACHAKFSSYDNGLGSFILLPNGERLFAKDILSLRLNTDLVFLSACESAKLGYTKGGDVLGLLSSFLYAGAKSVIASLWKINDYAAYIATIKFYENYLKKMNKAEALRISLLEVMKDFQHPYYWAPLLLVGSWT